MDMVIKRFTWSFATVTWVSFPSWTGPYSFATLPFLSRVLVVVSTSAKKKRKKTDSNQSAKASHCARCLPLCPPPLVPPRRPWAPARSPSCRQRWPRTRSTACSCRTARGWWSTERISSLRLGLVLDSWCPGTWLRSNLRRSGSIRNTYTAIKWWFRRPRGYYASVELTWNTVSKAIGNVLKFVGGVPSSKLNCPPNSCMPSSANISMNKNSRKSNDMIDLMELSNDITRFLNEDQYLEKRVIIYVNLYCIRSGSQSVCSHGPLAKIVLWIIA